MPSSQPFSRRRLQALCRLAAYALLFDFGINLLRALLPLPSDLEPPRLLGLVDALITISSLPLLGCVLMFAGFCEAIRPARWEWWLARLLGPLLVLVALAYTLLIPPTLFLGHQIRTLGEQGLAAERQESERQLAAYRLQLQQAPDSASLRRLLDAQPQLRQSLTTADSPFADPTALVARQRQLALRLLDRLSLNLRDASLRQRADASGQLQLQQLRLCGLALVYGFFFALVSLIWPRRLGPLPSAAPSVDRDAASP